MSDSKYTYYIEQDKDKNGNYIQSFSVYKTPIVKTIRLKIFKKLSEANDFLEKYESN
jgi:hypothetical protein